MAYKNTYPEPYKSAPQDSIVDRWLMYNRQCTSYCAWLLEHLNGIIINKTFPKRGSWNASNWAIRGREVGARVDKTPEVGAIAQWNSNHVAYVVEVGNGTVTILEYNYTTRGGWGQRVIKSNSVDNYIHFGGEASAREKLGGTKPVSPPPAKPPAQNDARYGFTNSTRKFLVIGQGVNVRQGAGTNYALKNDLKNTKNPVKAGLVIDIIGLRQGGVASANGRTTDWWAITISGGFVSLTCGNPQ